MTMEVEDTVHWTLGDSCHVFPYIRQVLSLCILPEVKDSLNVPDDICRLAASFRDWCDGYSVGSYSSMLGLHNTLEIIKDFIGQRDNIPYSDTGQLMINAQIEMTLNIALPILPGCHQDGTHAILVPGPVYPSIIDSIEVAGFRTVFYYLKEENGHWTVDVEALSEAIQGSTYPVMCMFVENPGYPTGHVYRKGELETLIRFAKEHELIIFAIENLQLDIHNRDERPFVSMRKVLIEMGSEFTSVQLFSFFTPNKSITGEAGMSITYVDTFRLSSEVFENVVKLTHNPPVLQQLYLSLILSPRSIQNEPSFKEFEKERLEILKRVSRIAKMVTAFFNSQPYITCSMPHAGQTVFPKLEFPQSWSYIGPRSSASLEEFYCQQLRDATKVPIVAGKFFYEYPGSSHFKFSFPVDEIKLLQKLDQFKTFHQNFIMTMVK